MIAAALICFASFGLLYGLTARSNLQLSDEAAVFATGISWIRDGDPAIDELQWLQNAENRSGGPGQPFIFEVFSWKRIKLRADLQSG